MKKIWSQFSEFKKTDTPRFIFMASSPQNVNRSTDERIGNDMAEKVEAQLIAGQNLSALKSLISKSLQVKTHYGSNLRLRNSAGTIVGRVKNGDSVIFLGETKITTDSHGQSRDTDRDGSLTNRHLWFKIKTTGGKTGWLSAEYLQGSLDTPVDQIPENQIEETPSTERNDTPENNEREEEVIIPAPVITKPEPEPLPDTIDFSRLPGASELRLGQIEANRNQAAERVVTPANVPDGSDRIIGRAEVGATQIDRAPDISQDIATRIAAQDPNLNSARISTAISGAGIEAGDTLSEIQGKIQKAAETNPALSDIAKAAIAVPEINSFEDLAKRINQIDPDLSEDRIRNILTDLNITDADKLPDIKAKLEGAHTKHGDDLGKVLDAAMRIPESTQFLALFRHPSLITFLKGSAVIGGGFMWSNFLRKGVLDFNPNQRLIMPRTGNAVADTGLYFVPFAGNLYDFEEAWADAKKGNLPGAVFNAFTGTVGMALDVFSVVTAPTGVGPIAGQSGRLAFKATMKAAKTYVKSGKYMQHAKSVGSTISQKVKEWSAPIAKLPGVSHAISGSKLVIKKADNFVKGMETKALANLKAAKEAPVFSLKRAGNSVAWAARETATSFYNVATFRFLTRPAQAVDAIRAARSSGDNNKFEVDGNSYNVGEKIHIKNETQARKGISRSDAVEITEITKDPSGETIIKGVNTHTGKSSTYKLSNLSDKNKYTITKETSAENIKTKATEAATKAKDILKRVSDKVIAVKESIKSQYQALIARFPKKEVNLKSLEAEHNKDLDYLETMAKESEQKIQDLKTDMEKPKKFRETARNNALAKKIEAEEAKLEKILNEDFTRVESEYEAKVKELTEAPDPIKPSPAPKPRKPRKPRTVPDELDTKLPSEIFSNRGGIGHLRTSKLEVGKPKTVNRTRDQVMQLQTSADKSAGIKLTSTETGIKIDTLRGYKGPKLPSEIPEGPGVEFKVDDTTTIHVKVELTAEGQKVYITRKNA